MFSSVTFWCEFPEKVNWKAFQKLIDFDSSVYVISKDRKTYEAWKKKIKSRNIEVGAWPALSFEEGYWFSGLCSKQSIDKLKEFNGLKIKIDLEPPKRLVTYSKLAGIAYALEYFLFRSYHNSSYLEETIYDLSRTTDIIVSGYPFPRRLSRRYGGDVKSNKNIRKNYFIYTSFFSSPIKEWLNSYYRKFIKERLKEEGERAMFALGCIGHGIYGNEPVYRNVGEFDYDLQMLNELCVKNLVVFEVSGIMNRSNPKEWINAIKEYLK
ncbi:hypothetical protein J4455_04560 [Candidatus Woesearchaeota archaeon]|nr:hypothetical protein [Candidatus Woesearchaeota archaeon]